MQLRRFRGRDMNTVMDQVVASLGSDAMILRTFEIEPFAGYGSLIEVVAAAGADVDRLRRRLFVDARPPRKVKGRAPRTIAFTGPPGAGKTTALLKLITDAAAGRDLSVGVLTLDTYRAGALDEILVYAGIHRVPLEVVYTEKEIPGALKGLSSADVILIDTPGRGGGRFQDEEWESMLERIRPDEVHLVLSSALRMDIAIGLRDRFRPMGPTHLLLTHLDEVDGDVGLTDLMMALELPARWVGDGADLEQALIPAEQRAFGALGMPAPDPQIRLEAV